MSLDPATVEGFGLEWSTYDQQARDPASIRASFDRYFRIFPWDELDDGATGADIGCGSGRWAALVAERGFDVIAIDPSPDALAVARRNAPECGFVQASAVELPLADDRLAFAFSLGVLHHVPDTEGAVEEVRRVLRPGAPFLVYLYYALDNRPAWFRALWRWSDRLRGVIARTPGRTRVAVTTAIAAVVYWPLARWARLVERAGRSPERIPLAAYRAQPFYVMRTDALDRFGTALEKRYTRDEVVGLLEAAGFRDVVVGDDWPYWCAVGRA